MKESIPDQELCAINTAEMQWPVGLVLRDVSPPCPPTGGSSDLHQASQALSAYGAATDL